VQPQSRQGGSYKSKTKSSAAQRESEGIVVPQSSAPAERTNVVKNNAAGGKGPWGGHVDGAGKREGMAGKTGPKGVAENNQLTSAAERILIRR
jgi:hypothetical protein